MGNDQSSPRNESRNSRNMSKEDVEKVLEEQRKLYEKQMKHLIQQQAAAKPQPTTATTPGQSGPSRQSTLRVPPERPSPPQPTKQYSSVEIKKLGQSTLGVPSQHPVALAPRTVDPWLETQRSTTLNTQTNRAEALKPTPLLYPKLDNGNSSLTPGHNNQNAFQNRAGNNNAFVFVNSHFKAPIVTPSAPPAPSSPPSRQRSVSRASPSSQTAQTGISCPTCKNHFGAKIFNCQSGHASCSNCKMQLRSCGICGATITQMRNISVEEYVSQFKVPCLNENEGCKLHFKLGEMDNHLKECPFKEIQCLLPGAMCLWKGKLSLLATHFDNFHPNHKGDVDTELFFKMDNICENKRMQLIKIGNFNFIFHLIISENQNKIYMVAQLLGTKFSAEKWTYEIHVYNKGAPRRKFQYSDKCISNTEQLLDLMRDNRCAVLPLSYAKTFINHGIVNYRLFITKDMNNSRRETRRDLSTSRRGARGRGRGGYKS